MKKNCCNHPKTPQRVMSPKYIDRMANKADPDQTAPLFAQIYLSKNSGSLR